MIPIQRACPPFIANTAALPDNVAKSLRGSGKLRVLISKINFGGLSKQNKESCSRGVCFHSVANADKLEPEVDQCCTVLSAGNRVPLDL